MTPSTYIQEILSEMDAALPSAVWEPAVTTKEHQAIVYRGTSGPWTFVVSSFSIEDQGFAQGSRGHDGMGSKSGVICRFTRPLAEKAFKFAQGN